MDALIRYQGALGAVAILAAVWLLSENRRAISVRTVLGGLTLQCGLGFLLLRSAAGRSVLDGAAAWVNSILACAMTGAEFLFGEELTRADGPVGFVFAVQVLPAIIAPAATRVIGQRSAGYHPGAQPCRAPGPGDRGRRRCVQCDPSQ